MPDVPDVIARLSLETNGERMVVYVSRSLQRRVEEVATKNHRSVSDWVRLTLAEVIAGQRPRVDLT